jgi:hypothetical protein
MSAFVVALAVVSILWRLSQTASADPDGVALVHVNPDGSDFVGNPYCPQTVWENGVPLSVDPRHDCNNITNQKHVIRTDGFTTGEGEFAIEGVGIILAEGLCNDIPEVARQRSSCWPTPSCGVW